MDLVRDVIRAAINPGYLVAVRGQQRVYRLVDKDTANPVPRYESDTVHQLIDTGWLRTGDGRYRVTVGAVTIETERVLVPKSTRHTASRWNALKPLPGGRTEHTA